MPARSLVVFYSRSGVTKLAALAIADRLDCDVEPIQDVRSRKGLFGFLRSGYEAARRKLPAIKPTQKDPARYDLVILGTPVWGNVMASPLRTYLSRNKDRIQQMAVFCTIGGSGGDRTLTDVAEFCGKTPAASLVLNRKEVFSGQYTEKLDRFLAAFRL